MMINKKIKPNNHPKIVDGETIIMSPAIGSPNAFEGIAMTTMDKRSAISNILVNDLSNSEKYVSLIAMVKQ